MGHKTFARHQEQLVKDGCQIISGPQLTDQDGQQCKTRFITRVNGDKLLVYPIRLDDGDMVEPNIIRGFCKRLKLQPKDYGLPLG